jgi:transcriptional regulator with XRE-family HTH domain
MTVSLSLLIRTARAEKGLTLRQLADLSGVDFKAINRIEKGHTKRPHLQTLAALASHLDIELQELVAAGSPEEVAS